MTTSWSKTPGWIEANQKQNKSSAYICTSTKNSALRIECFFAEGPPHPAHLQTQRTQLRNRKCGALAWQQRQPQSNIPSQRLFSSLGDERRQKLRAMPLRNHSHRLEDLCRLTNQAINRSISQPITERLDE